MAYSPPQTGASHQTRTRNGVQRLVPNCAVSFQNGLLLKPFFLQIGSSLPQPWQVTLVSVSPVSPVRSKPSVIRRDFQNNYREARFQDY